MLRGERRGHSLRKGDELVHIPYNPKGTLGSPLCIPKRGGEGGFLPGWGEEGGELKKPLYFWLSHQSLRRGGGMG